MRKQEARKSIWALIILLILVVGTVFILYKFLFPEKKLPVYNPYDVNPDLVDPTISDIKKGHHIADFRLINQNGDTITQEDYKDKIYVADFFFTRCQTICPVMTSNMKTIQDTFINDDQVKFLSHSVTPVMDSIPILRAYADKKGVIDAKWNVTTGDKKEIYKLARKSYFAVLDEGDGGLQDFVHTENFILVDKQRQIRGFYDGTDLKDIQRLINDIKLLEKEYE
jgi:protein SCO1/2